MPLRSTLQHTQGYSGADITEICQRAVKYAIRESIEKVGCGGVMNLLLVWAGGCYELAIGVGGRVL